MAGFIASSPINLLNPSVWYGEVKSATPTTLTISDGQNTATYTGTGFTYSGNHVVGGTLTGYTQYANNVMVGNATGFSVSAAVADAYISANDLPGLLSIILSDSDGIGGSPGNDLLAGYGGGDTLSGRGGDDSLYGGAGRDILDGGPGMNYLNGGDDLDAALFLRNIATVKITRQGDVFFVSSTDGTTANTLINMELIVFYDGAVACSEGASQAYRLYEAAFNRTPDKVGVTFWVDKIHEGMALKQAAASFIASNEFTGLYGSSPTDTKFVDLLYRNVLDRAPDQSGYDFWLGKMKSGMEKSDVLMSFSESAENVNNTSAALVGGVVLDMAVYG